MAANTAMAGTLQMIPNQFRPASHLSPSPSARHTPIEGRYKYLSWMTNSGSNLLIATSAGANQTANQTAHRIKRRDRVITMAPAMQTIAARHPHNAKNSPEPPTSTYA